MICPYCTTKNLPGTQVCAHCGAILREIKRARPAPKEHPHLAGAAKSLLVGNKWRAQHAHIHSQIKHAIGKAEEKIEADLKAQGSNPQARLTLALLHIMKNEHERGVQEFQQAQRLGACGLEFNNNAGVALAKRGNLPQAVEMFDRAAAAPDSANANGVQPHANLAYVLSRLADGRDTHISDQAVHEVQKALKGDPKNPKHYNRLGLILCLDGRCEEGLAQFGEALRLATGSEPGEADAHNNRGLAQALAGEIAEAADEFQTALKLDCGHGHALCNQALLQLKQGQVDAALGLLYRAVRLCPASALVRSNYGCALSKALAINEGIREFKEAIALDPHIVEPVYNQAKSYADEGLYDIAERYLARAQQLRPEKWEILNTMGVVRMALHQMPQALECLQAANKLCHNQKLILANLGLCLALSGHDVEAERAFRQAAQVAKDDPEINMHLAWLYMRRHSISQAVAELQIALDRNDKLAVAHNNYGLCEIEMGSYEEATKHFRKALAIDPEMGAVRYHIGSVHMLLKQIDMAVKEWDTAAKLEPTNADCLANLGVAYYKEGKMDTAVIEFRRVITLRQTRMEDFSNLALAYGKQAMALKRQSRKPDDLKAKESRERSKIAVEMFDRALELRPNNVMLHSNRGLACFFANRPEEAVVEWTMVTRIDPDYARRRGKSQQTEFDDTMIAYIPIDVAVRAMPLPAKTAGYLTRYVPSYDIEEMDLVIGEENLQSIPEMTREAHRLERLIHSL